VGDNCSRHKNHFWKKILFATVVTIAIIGIIGTVLFYNKYQQIKNNPVAITKQEADIIVQRVGKLMVLPTGESPTIATVTDKTELTSQAFFKDAQNGDKLLVYTIAKKAILYQPSSNKIVNIAPFDLSSVDAGTKTTDKN
jgi:hypothetical protein